MPTTVYKAYTITYFDYPNLVIYLFISIQCHLDCNGYEFYQKLLSLNQQFLHSHVTIPVPRDLILI